MVTISVLDIAGAADTTEQGQLFWPALSDALATSDEVVVSFSGVTSATSSFVNVSFVRLLETMPFDEIRRRLRIVESSRQINDMIKTRLQREAAAFA